jgi:hypothetical protein
VAKPPTVTGEETPCLVGIDRDQRKSASQKFADTWNQNAWRIDRELRYSHHQGDIPLLGVILEGPA